MMFKINIINDVLKTESLFRSDEYQNRYKRGLLYYLRDEYIVGIVFWNMAPMDERKDVATEVNPTPT